MVCPVTTTAASKHRLHVRLFAHQDVLRLYLLKNTGAVILNLERAVYLIHLEIPARLAAPTAAQRSEQLSAGRGCSLFTLANMSVRAGERYTFQLKTLLPQMQIDQSVCVCVHECATICTVCVCVYIHVFLRPCGETLVIITLSGHCNVAFLDTTGFSGKWLSLLWRKSGIRLFFFWNFIYHIAAFSSQTCKHPHLVDYMTEHHEFV